MLRTNKQIRLVAALFASCFIYSASYAHPSSAQCPDVEDEGLFDIALLACDAIVGNCKEKAKDAGKQLVGGFTKAIAAIVKGPLQTKVEKINQNLPPDQQLKIDVQLSAPKSEAACDVFTRNTPNTDNLDQLSVQELRPVLLHYTFRIEPDNSVSIAPLTHNFQSGDAFILGIATNLPGIIDVYNIAPSGTIQRFPEDSVYLDDAGVALIPENQEFVLDDEKGDETLHIQFYPCTGAEAWVESTTEGIYKRQRTAAMTLADAGVGTVRGEILEELPDCASVGAARDFQSIEDSEGLFKRATSTSVSIGSDVINPVVATVTIRNR